MCHHVVRLLNYVVAPTLPCSIGTWPVSLPLHLVSLCLSVCLSHLFVSLWLCLTCRHVVRLLSYVVAPTLPCSIGTWPVSLPLHYTTRIEACFPFLHVMWCVAEWSSNSTGTSFPVANVTGKSPASYEEVGRVASLLRGSYEEAGDFQTISTCPDGLATSPTSS